jgi:hypothetical protein
MDVDIIFTQQCIALKSICAELGVMQSLQYNNMDIMQSVDVYSLKCAFPLLFILS